jgi:methylphosphotriester-DNA--protein-cysteine methyltransferase
LSAASEASTAEANICSRLLGAASPTERNTPTVSDPALECLLSHLGHHFRAATGTTPLPWLLTQRIRHAQELLEKPMTVFDTIAAATGMGTATTLRRHLNRTVGVPGHLPPHLPPTDR